MVANEVPLLVRFEGGPTDDGKAVIVNGRLADKSRATFAIETDKVSWLIGKLAEWTREAASKAGWKAQPIDQQDDTSVWMRPTQYGLIDAGKPDKVHLAIDVGPVRFRLALTKPSALELGRVLQAAVAPMDRTN
jgi:hypothetical protein